MMRITEEVKRLIYIPVLVIAAVFAILTINTSVVNADTLSADISITEPEETEEVTEEEPAAEEKKIIADNTNSDIASSDSAVCPVEEDTINQIAREKMNSDSAQEEAELADETESTGGDRHRGSCLY